MVAARLLSTWQPARLVVLDCQPASLMEKSHTLCGSFFIFRLGSGVNRVTDSQPSPIAFLLSPEPLLLLPRPPIQEESRPLYGPMNCTPLSVTSKPLATQAKISSFIHPAAYESPGVPIRLVVHATVTNSTLAWRDILVAPSPRLALGDSAPAYRAKYRQE